MRKLSCLTAMLAGAVVTSACEIKASPGAFDMDFAGGKATETWQRTYDVSGSSRFELINVNGKITAEQSDGRTLEVEARKTARAWSDSAAKDLLDSVEIHEDTAASLVRI